MIKIIIKGLISLLLMGWSMTTLADPAKEAIILDIKGVIGPAAQDYVEQGIQYATKHEASIIILRIDTPGGLQTSMRGINQAILSASIPIVAYVAPSGAQAASAGTFILYASPIAAMAPGTNLGAAHPVELTNGNDTSSKPSSVMQEKATNDAAAYIRSLAELRGRNIAWAEKAVTHAVSLSAAEALKMKVINVTANDIPELLEKINGEEVSINDTLQTLDTTDLTLHPLPPNWRYQFLSLITHPNIAYILFLIGVYGLFFEFANPGFILPGVCGGIALLTALYAFQWLPIHYAGFALLLLGIAFMIVELFISSFGVLGIGGVIAFIIGSILLFDNTTPGFNLAWQLIVVMGLISATFFFIVAHLAVKAWRQKVVSGQEALINSEGEVLEYTKTHITVKIHGEIWNACSKYVLKPGQPIRVVSVSGLLLTVEPIE